jgi:antitoxin component YwqK of YwqJK toxin-antitoxin module
MAMAFTAHRVLLLSNWFLTIALLVGACSCNLKSDSEAKYREVPLTYVDASQGAFETGAGITFLRGKPFSGRQYELYDNGDTAYIFPYYEGKLEGKCQKWYQGHKLQEVRWYYNGKKEGTHTGWYPDGKKCFEYHIKDDVYEGSVKEWYASGQIYRDFNFKNGQEDGPQKLYFIDGTYRANYIVKNGRKYGLTGIKECSSEWNKNSVAP